MPAITIREGIRRNGPLLSDGAWGTELQARGLAVGECPELWNLERRDRVAEVAAGYVGAGADLIGTNSFGGSRYKLDNFGLGGRAAEINRAAAEISREAAGDAVWVIGSIGPTGKMLLMGEVTEEELAGAFAEQVVALAAGGVDAICVETMSATDEATLAVRTAKEHTDCEVISTYTYERTSQGEYRTMMGVAPAEGARASLDAGADIIGTNCGNGIAGMVEVVTEIRRAIPDAPLLVHANAGVPRNEGGRTVFPDTPEDMAAEVGRLVDAGADVVGGCCGSGPAHIAAMRTVLDARRSA